MWFFSAGFLSALAVCFKQVALSNYLFFALILLLGRAHPRTFRFRALLQLAGGGLSVAAAVLLYFAAKQSLGVFFRYAFLFGLRYSAGFDLNDALFRLFYVTGTLGQEELLLILGTAVLFLGGA